MSFPDYLKGIRDAEDAAEERMEIIAICTAIGILVVVSLVLSLLPA